jgi:predicted phosphodiesterase
VRLAFFADIHANRQAFAACLDAARANGAERFICLGDYVGYGADPEWTVETVMGLVEQGALAVRGNHDTAISSSAESMNAEAQAAIEWTRGRLGAPERKFLSELPLTRDEDDRLYVHSDASQPAKWHYVRSTADAGRSLIATDAHITFCGHIHRPALYSMSVTGKDDELHSDFRHQGAAVAGPALARGYRLGRPASRRRSGGMLCDVRHGLARNHLLPRSL